MINSAGEELIESTLAQCRQTFQTLGRTSATDWLQLELSMAQVKALFVLLQEQPLTVSALADRLGVGISAGSRVVDRLVQFHLVERSDDPDNRRRSLVRLTGHGGALINRLQQGRLDRLRRCLRQLSEEQLSGLINGLRALDEAAGAVADEEERAAS